MKKTLIAVAALAATSAFAQVTITGTLDATVRNTKQDNFGGTSISNTAVGSNGSGTTAVIVKAVEDLGGGLKAIGLYELDMRMDNAGTTAGAGTTGTPASAETYVGLEGSFGSFKLGTPNSPTLTTQGATTPFTTKDGGRTVLISGTSVVGESVTRNSGSMVYATPNMSGFSAALGYTPKVDTATATTTGAKTDLGVFYKNGPLGVNVSSYTVAESTTGNDDVKLTSYNGSYNFGFAAVTLGGHSYKKGTTAAENTGLVLSAAVPLSAKATLQFAMQKVDDKLVGNNDTNMSAIGLNYALSAKTSTYVRYVNQTVDNVTTAGNGEKATAVMAGLRMGF